MKNLAISYFSFLVTSLCFLSANAQTNVSGGIFTNTTWNVGGSPYIVVDTVVVFPGVTLTIQPGVTVKFADNKRLEIRQAKLIAVGTSTDSITFTSNSNSPASGIWSGVYFNPNNPPKVQRFNYCNFFYADNALEQGSGDSLIIKNSNFRYNNSGVGNNNVYGIYTVIIDSSIFKNNLCGVGSFYTNPYGTRLLNAVISNSSFVSNQQAGIVIGYSDIANCILNSNQTGIWANQGENVINNCIIDSNSVQGYYSFESANDFIINCQIKHNEIGIFDNTNNAYPENIITQNIIENNTIGIKSSHPQDNIYCNRICNNTSYDFYNNSNTNISIPNNSWCTLDSASIENLIYDAHDNPNVGLTNFIPVDTANCYLTYECLSYFTLAPDFLPYHYFATNMSVGTNPINYTWDWGDGNFDYTAYPSHTYADTGTYTICLTINDTTGCTDSYCNTVSFKTEAQMVYVNVIPVGINNYDAKDTEMLLYPNPANEYITLEFADYNSQPTVKIINYLGQVLFTTKLSSQNSKFDVSEFPNGIYHLLLEDEQGKVNVKKFLVSK